MSYLNNSSVVVDAILTKRGRELMSQGKLNIKKFALSDDEIDYTLYNPIHTMYKFLLNHLYIQYLNILSSLYPPLFYNIIIT